ncbi:SDR family NAD(P)-dependent oxidoreductase [Pseudooceanicola sp. LIPI14-2-Ac024]|uniref:SDR family NAD(P)-dependent oxidoreductase n=1 Tax=Pseudooceanicola sp. LIPI14-2-Ac024 TaxID=3344875 RepID=UPI0035D0A450
MGERSILITGCSSGIGLDAARTLRARGWRVFAACRREADCARLRDEGFESPRIDHGDMESIATGLAEVLAATGGRLDALFNNGGHGLTGAVEDVPVEGLREIFASNLFGWHELTRRVIPVMRAQGHGRIVQCSSVLGYGAMRWRGAYVATKHALEGLTKVMRLELRGEPIEVVLIQPGPVTSDFRFKGRAMFEKYIDWEASAHAEMYRTELVPRLYGPQGKDSFELPAAAVTQKLIHALEARRPRARYRVTLPAHVTWWAGRLLPGRLVEAITAQF